MKSFGASGFSTVRLSDDSRTVTIGFSSEGGKALDVALPVEELPELVLYLSRAVARHHADMSGFPVMAYTLPVHDGEVVTLSSPESAALVLTLREGLRVPFSVPRTLCETLAAQFAEAAAKS